MVGGGGVVFNVAHQTGNHEEGTAEIQPALSEQRGLGIGTKVVGRPWAPHDGTTGRQRC
jgi:hypothetical protein